MTIPYAVFENEPEKTLDPVLIGRELEAVAGRLWICGTAIGWSSEALSFLRERVPQSCHQDRAHQ